MEQVTLSVPAAHGDASGTLAGARPAPRTSTSANLVIALDRGIYRIARHWLLAVNALFVTYMASLLLAPMLVAWGYAGLARPIYAFNGLFCHQRDNRSFSILGEKMACCERCAAIYGSMMLAGLAFAFVRGHIRRPRLSDVLLLALPIAVDGGAQLVGLWKSTTGSRLLSGAVFGVAVCWFLLPYLESGFGRMRAQLETLFARLVAEGRAGPLR
jgi:uncharacterized membrane protein